MRPAEILQCVWGVLSLLGWGYLIVTAARGRLRDWFPAQPREPVPWDVVLAVAALVASYGFLPALISSALRIPPREKNSLLTAVDLQAWCLSNLAAVVVIAGILWLGTGARWADFGVRRWDSRRDLWRPLLGLWLCWAPVMLIEWPLQAIRKENPHELLKFLHGDSDGSFLFLITLQLMVVGPVAEEFVFRVVLQSSLMRWLPAWLSILLVAVAFCGVHQIEDSAPLLPLALLLGIVYHTQRSLWSVWIFHGLFNGMNLIIALLSPPVPMQIP